jgi:type IV pilus biogenesis protein CpaD/CtpE
LVLVNFAQGAGQLSAVQVKEIRDIVASGRRANRDEFLVVSDGSGGALQEMDARRVGQTLSEAGARWVNTAVEPTMATGPNSVIIVRSEYLIASSNCPRYIPASQWNPNEAAMPGFGCADAHNMGQMLARPRDAAVGRSPGPADGTVSAAAIRRYREGRVRSLDATGNANTGANPSGPGGDMSNTTTGPAGGITTPGSTN